MQINPTGVILALISFATIILILFTYERRNSKYKVSELDKRLSKVDESTEEREEISNKKVVYKNMNPLDKLQYNLDEGEIKLNIFIFIGIFFVSTLILYFVALSIFKQPLVALSPLPFTIFFLPKMIIDSQKRRVMKKFNEELTIVLRRMSSVLQTGSILQALDEVKDIPSLSNKMRDMLNQVHHRYNYGEDIITAFQKSSEHINCENLEIAIVSLDLNKDLGADLGSSLNEISKRIQSTLLAKKEAESLMASTLVIGQVLSVAPFGIIGYLVSSNPDYFTSYLTSFSNQLLFMGLVGVMFFGIYLVNTKTKFQ